MSRILIAAMTAATVLTGLGTPDASAAGWGAERRDPPPMEREQRVPEPRHAAPPVHRELRHWRPGDRLPGVHSARRHVIAAPAAHHLHRPPRGHHWVRAGSDALLVVSGSGVVVRVVPGLFR